MQILVVVASIQMRTLKAEVEKGSVRTAIGHGLVDPKALGNSVQKVRAGWHSTARAPARVSLYRSRRRPKGNQVNIPEPKLG